MQDRLSITIPKNKQAKLKYINEFDYSKIAKKVREQILSATDKYLQEGIEQLKRYYTVRLLDPDQMHGVSVPVDMFWHTHVLFTCDYFDFCKRVYGHYIHHMPIDRDDAAAFKEIRKIYRHTLSVHHKLFKDVDRDWWPSAESPRGAICTMY